MFFVNIKFILKMVVKRMLKMLYLLIQWLILTLIVLFTAWILPGITVSSIPSAMVAAVVIGMINVSIKPVLNWITLPFNVVTFGILALVINALLLLFTAYLVPGFNINGFWSAFFGSIIISLLSLGISYIKY